MNYREKILTWSSSICPDYNRHKNSDLIGVTMHFYLGTFDMDKCIVKMTYKKGTCKFCNLCKDMRQITITKDYNTLFQKILGRSPEKYSIVFSKAEQTKIYDLFRF